MGVHNEASVRPRERVVVSDGTKVVIAVALDDFIVDQLGLWGTIVRKRMQQGTGETIVVLPCMGIALVHDEQSFSLMGQRAAERIGKEEVVALSACKREAQARRRIEISG